jgi:hypothetical protein
VTLALVGAVVAVCSIGITHALSVVTGNEEGEHSGQHSGRNPVAGHKGEEAEGEGQGRQSFISAFLEAAGASRARAVEAAVTAAWFSAATLITPTVTAGLIRGALGADDTNEDPDDRRPAAAVAATLTMLVVCISAMGVAVLYARRRLVYVDGVLDGADSKTFRKSNKLQQDGRSGGSAHSQRQGPSGWAKVFRKKPPADVRGCYARFSWYVARAWRRFRRYLLRPRGEWAQRELEAEAAARAAGNTTAERSGDPEQATSAKPPSAAAERLHVHAEDGQITGATLCMPLVDDYTRGCVWFAFIELFVQLALGVAGAAAELAERGMVSCVIAVWAAVGPLTFYLLVLVLANPHRTRLGYYSALVPNSIVLGLSLAMAALIQTAYVGDFLPDAAWLEVLVLWVETTAMVQAIYGLTLQVLALIESWRWRRTLDLARRTRSQAVKEVQTRLVSVGAFQMAVLRIFGPPKAPLAPPPPPLFVIVEEDSPPAAPQSQQSFRRNGSRSSSVSSSSTGAAVESDDEALDPTGRGAFRRFERWLQYGDDADGTNERVVRLLHC